MTGNKKPFRRRDIPIEQLIPPHKRKSKPRHQKRLETSLRALGQIDPLIVCPQGDKYRILDGCHRYRILMGMGVETVPCLIWNPRPKRARPNPKRARPNFPRRRGRQ